MKEIQTLLNNLEKEGIAISLNGENLDVSIYKEDIDEKFIDLIRENKQSILDFLKEREQRTGFTQIPSVEVTEDNGYPVSYAQKRLWFLHQFDPNTTTYNIPGELLLPSDYDVSSLRLSVSSVIARHESLRTVFRESEQGEVKQYVLAQGELDFIYEEGLTELAIKERISSDMFESFDLSTGPLLRVRLYRKEDGDLLFYYNMHHIISDGWSREVLFRDVSAYYAHYTKGVALSLPDLPIQYKDYASWQLSLLSSASWSLSQSYWQDQFSEATVPLSLPSDLSRPLVKTTNGCYVSSYILPHQHKSLKDYSVSKGGSLFTGLLSCFKILLYRYTSQGDITIGSPLSGRSHIDLENQIGFYVNTLVFRSVLSGSMSVSEAFSSVQQVVLDGYSHQDYPFDRLVEDLSLPRDTSRTPLFDVMLSLQNNGSVRDFSIAANEALAITHHGRINSKFDLLVSFKELGDYLSMSIEYNSDVYEPWLIDQLIVDYRNLLDVLFLDDQIELGKLVYQSFEERSLLLSQGQGPVQDTGSYTTVTDLLCASMQAHGSKRALQYGSRSYSYAELDSLSNQLAHCIVEELGSCKDRVIGVHQTDKLTTIVSILAIVKSGGCYVPIDVHYPSERIAYIKEDSQLELLLDDAYYASFMDTASEYSSSSLPVSISGSDLLYVIYTSGSTGSPKGIMMEHRNSLNLLLDQHSEYRITSSLQFAGISFDVSFQEIFTTLTQGGCLHLISEEDKRDPSLLTDLVVREGIDTLYFPTAYFRLLMEQGEYLSSMSSVVDRIFVAGEQLLFSDSFMRFMETSPFVLYNHYGPAETHVVTSLAIDGTTISNQGSIPSIGYPVHNTSIYIVDQQGSLTSKGVIGELCIGGAQVARGYISKPEQTSERFVSDPFVEGGRMYKTGDLAKWNADGSLSYIGRRDHQVKIRGYRIELGELESTLLDHELIVQAVVISKQNTTGEQELYCYYVSSGSLEHDEVLSYLGSKLPEYMLPHYLKALDSLPLTSNGKVAKDRLPSITERVLGTSLVLPETALELELSEIWKSLLNLSEIGITMNFFEIGGHSLKAVRLLGHYRKDLGVTLSLKDLFLHTTIQSQARLISGLQSEEFISIPKVEVSEDGYAISDAQRRLWVLSQIEETSIAYNVPDQVILPSDYDVSSLRLSVSSVIARHESLRTVFRESEQGEVKQYVLAQGELDFIYEEGLTELAIKERISSDMFESFDLSTGPLLRVRLYRKEDGDLLFYYNMHHIISDGWSREVLFRDVSAYYAHYTKGVALSLPDLPIQYKDYASWQLSLLSSASWSLSQSYWQDQFSEATVPLSLPSDLSRPLVKTTNGCYVSSYILPHQHKSLKDYSVSKGGSLFTGLLSCFKILLYRYTSQGDITIGSPLSGRSHIDLENQIGFYVNTLVFRSVLSGSMSVSEAFSSVQQVVLDGYSHQDYPFDRLVEDLSLPRDTSRTPLFDVMLSLQNNGSVRDFSIAANEALAITHHGRINSKFDLLVSFKELGDYLSMSIEYNSDVYEPWLIDQLIVDYRNLLDVLFLDDQIELGKLVYQSFEERSLLLSQGQGPVQDTGSYTTVTDLLCASMQAHGSKRALQYGSRSYSYAELDSLSNQLAHCIVEELGSCKDRVIGVHQTDKLTTIVSILAIVKSGGCYVPIDVHYPSERIAYIKEDSQLELLLDDAYYASFMDTASEYSSSSLPVSISGSDLLYVIYTSGSTGSPKGIMMEHRNSLNLLLDQHSEYRITSSLQFAGISFDVSFQEIFTTLTQGGCLHLISEEDKRDPSLLTDLVVREGIDTLYFPTAYFRLLMEQGEYLSSMSSVVDRIFVAGEQLLFSDSFMRFMETSPFVLYNHYGPAETHVVTSLAIDGTTISNQGSIPSIGYPVHNTSIYIVDQQGSLTSKGVIGELCIGGAQVARGYISKPEQTSERFVSDPFVEGGRMYKTGDLAKWNADGSLSYIGRRDHQVKIRGYRIELGELESTLLDHQEIEQVHVLTTDKENGEKELCAFYTSSVSLTANELKSYLGSKLPTYMTPSLLVQLENFPLNRNGKVDKQELLRNLKESLPTEQKELPVTELEKQLAELWGKYSHANEVGIDDNYWEMGGTSINGVRLIREVRNRIHGTEQLQLGHLFTYPTIRQFVRILEKKERENELLKGVMQFGNNMEGKSIVFLPGYQGVLDTYYQWLHQMGEEHRIYGVDLHS